jgi:protoporphyrinogen oxidase
LTCCIHMYRSRRVAVLGGGISGLTSAFLLRQLPSLGLIVPDVSKWVLQGNGQRAREHEQGTGGVLLLEKANRLGGWINTQRKGSFIFEAGPSRNIHQMRLTS